MKRPNKFAGFTLVELMVALLISVFVIGGAYTLLQSGTDFAGEQRGRIEMQESARGAFEVLAEMSRNSGFGGLPIDVEGQELPSGVSISVRNNVKSQKILNGSSLMDIPSIVDDTDVLIVRGSLDESSIYRLPLDPTTAFKLVLDDSSQGDLVVRSTLSDGWTQDLDSLIDVVKNAKAANGQPTIPEALLVVSSFDPELYCILQLDPEKSDITDPDQVVLRVLMPLASEDRVANQYQTLCPGGSFPQILKDRLQETNHSSGEIFALGSLAVLQERRFYLRQTTDDENTHRILPPLPMLSSARVLPGTEIPYAGDIGYLAEDVATGIIDLQVELGFDTVNGGTWNDGTDLVDNPSGSTEDDWLFNNPNDNPDQPPWANRSAGQDAPIFQYLRLHLIALTDEVDRRHLAAPLTQIADHVYGPGNPFNESPYTTLRRIELVTTIDARNLRRYR